MKISGTTIEDTFAEAFGMRYTRLIVTAHDEHWLASATSALTGYGSSVIACDAEAGVQQLVHREDSPDGRPGAAILLFGFNQEAVGKAAIKRIGQCVMTCPTTAVFNGLPDSETKLPLGKSLRYFGDGFQKSKQVGGRRFWRIPVMDGEFLVEESLGIERGVAGGNLLLLTRTQEEGLTAVRRAVEAIRKLQTVILPFPGGVARSGSKVGSRYKGLIASTADAFCPTLRGRVESRLPAEVNCVLEIVIDGPNEAAVGHAMAVGIRAAAGPDVVQISAGNYGGKLGKFSFHLHKLIA